MTTDALSEARNKFLGGLAWFISYVFHPALLPTWLFLILVLVMPEALSPVSKEGAYSLLLVLFVSTCLMPCFMLLALLLLFKKNFTWKHVHLDVRQDRIAP